MVEQARPVDCERCGPPMADAAAARLDVATLITVHHRDVYRYAYRLCGRQADAEDLTQQTFLVAQQRLHQLREPDKSLSWLFTIVRNCYLKSQSKRRPVAAASVELDVDSIPEEVSEDDIDRPQLQLAIDELPEEFKIVLVMFYFEECSYKEIAAQLGISIGTVMSRLARAKGRLRKLLLPAETEAGPDAAKRADQASGSRSAWVSPETDHRPS
ncbi:MAG: sigma-70 family RNA polymerase sigma factor [Planctomycetota bacterium]|nr:sigma-70 family RNA polymerase sigma factor [Planctomycetota bacterium]